MRDPGDFLVDQPGPIPWQLPDGGRGSFEAGDLFLGKGTHPLEVAVATAPARPNVSDVRQLWKRRKDNRPAPVLLIVLYQGPHGLRAAMCGPTGDNPSYFADTAGWINDYLEHLFATDRDLALYRDRLAKITGSAGDKSEVLFGFAPVSSEAPEGLNQDRYDVLVSTDVLAEGVNLQQARHIINFDLPWNPMRMVQRHGRIDRIGSLHDRVYVRCFFRLGWWAGLGERSERGMESDATGCICSRDEALPSRT